MIEISQVTKSYSDTTALNGIDLTVETGSIFGLVGINGAGKSTLLRILAGVMRPDSGSVLIDGKPVYENEETKKKIFFLPDEPFYTSGITPSELMKFYSTFYNVDKEAFFAFCEKLSLPLKKPMRNFSKGMKRQTYLSLAIACKPEYLLLDEAFDGLDPLSRLECKRALIDLCEECGTTVIISSHSLRELEDICDSYGLIDNKKISGNGNISEEVKKIYKFQLAFEKEIDRSKLDFDVIDISTVGRVIKVIASGDKEEILRKIEALDPLIVDELPVDFEELFLYQVKKGEKDHA